MAKTDDLVAKRRKMKQADVKRVKASDVISPSPEKKKKKVQSQDTPPAVTKRPGFVKPKKTMALSVSAKGGALAVPDRSRMIDQGDFVIPKVKISQGLSKVNIEDKVRQGNWYHTLRNNSLGKSIYIVLVDMRKSQSVFKQGQGVICRSFDLVQGEGDPGILCEGTPREIKLYRASDRGCPLRLWTTNEKTNKRVPPECQLAYNFPILLLDSADPENGKVRKAMMTLRSSATKAAANMISIVQDEDEPCWYDHIFKLTLELKTFDNGNTTFIPTVEYVGETNARLKERAKNLAQVVTDQFVRANLESSDTED